MTNDCSAVTAGAPPEDTAAAASSVQVPAPVRSTVAEPAELDPIEHAPGVLLPSTVMVTVPGMSGGPSEVAAVAVAEYEPPTSAGLGGELVNSTLWVAGATTVIVSAAVAAAYPFPAAVEASTVQLPAAGPNETRAWLVPVMVQALVEELSMAKDTGFPDRSEALIG